MSKPLAALLGAVTAAFGASLCCILPVAVAVAGVGSAAAGAALEPVRPLFVVLTAGLLGYAAYREYRPPRDCAPGEPCELPRKRRLRRLVLWVAAFLALALVTFPYYAGRLL